MSREAQAWKRAGDRWLGRKDCPWLIRWWHRYQRWADVRLVFPMAAREAAADGITEDEMAAGMDFWKATRRYWHCPCAAEKGRDHE